MKRYLVVLAVIWVCSSFMLYHVGYLNGSLNEIKQSNKLINDQQELIELQDEALQNCKGGQPRKPVDDFITAWIPP